MSIKPTKYRIDYTKYKTIYKDTYWAGHGFDPLRESILIDEYTQIGKNRDSFVETHNIKKHWNMTQAFERKYYKDLNPARRKSYCDHIEWYKTKDRYAILLISPYSLDDEILTDNSFGVPFIKTDDLYGLGAHSFYKKIKLTHYM